jgi:phospholipid-binding lipoprotein MlaA
MSKDMLTRSASWGRVAFAAITIAALSGCASTNPKDPFESYNRAMFKVNDKVDQVALKPAATAYKRVLPSFVQTGVSNFFGNLGDVWTGANNLMQGKGEAGMSDLTRVAMNSTFGLFGLLDIASEAGLQKHKEDFGQTLGYWGVAPGPYVMLPLLGPSTLRDTAGLALDLYVDPWGYTNAVNVRNVGTGVRIIDQRAEVLDASNLMEEAALDRYIFIRDGFLQRRQGQVFDGEASRKDMNSVEEPAADAKSIKAAYADDPGPSAPAAGAAGAVQAAPAPAATTVTTPVSSESGAK